MPHRPTGTEVMNVPLTTSWAPVILTEPFRTVVFTLRQNKAFLWSDDPNGTVFFTVEPKRCLRLQTPQMEAEIGYARVLTGTGILEILAFEVDGSIT